MSGDCQAADNSQTSRIHFTQLLGHSTLYTVYWCHGPEARALYTIHIDTIQHTL